LASELREADIRNGLREAMVLQHPGHIEIFNHDD